MVGVTGDFLFFARLGLKVSFSGFLLFCFDSSVIFS